MDCRGYVGFRFRVANEKVHLVLDENFAFYRGFIGIDTNVMVLDSLYSCS